MGAGHNALVAAGHNAPVLSWHNATVPGHRALLIHRRHSAFMVLRHNVVDCQGSISTSHGCHETALARSHRNGT